MALISVSPDELRAKAAQLEAYREEQDDILRQLRILVQNLSDNWKGNAQTAYYKSFTNRQSKMQELSLTLQDYIDILYQAATDAEQLDAELYSQIAALIDQMEV